MKDINLADLVDPYILQELQDFCVSRFKIPIGVSGADGIGLTSPCELREFCQVYTKGTEEGLRRCTDCDCKNAQKALVLGTVSSYTCHAGLVDFTAPIVVEGMLVGFVVGGQISTSKLEKEKIYAYAEELGIDKEAYWRAAQDVQIIDPQALEEVLKVVERTARIISDIATNKYHIMLANKEIENAAKMKSDFLANMSHEIRTPMNAVIGMADMALREELSPNARKYIRQIKNSGKALLAIINDILDFSKIEAGKMDINLCEYSPYDLIDDISNIIATRIKDKDIELVVDVAPDIPKKLMGDSIRIRQIIINLANNAVKFTNQGKVCIKVTAKEIKASSYELSVSVADTGIGIKPEDLNKIFDSFQQVDSKRNRNIEGSGLGLAISKQLVDLMGGSMNVESEYDVGSEFSFTIPQLLLGQSEKLEVKAAKDIHIFAWLSNSYTEQQLCKDVTRLGCNYTEIMLIDQLNDMAAKGCDFFFIDSLIYEKFIKDEMSRLGNIRVVLLEKFYENYENYYDNLVILKKPISVYHLYKLFNNIDIHAYTEDEDICAIDFEAPDASVLIVDDNEINLDVAAGLLEPLMMQVERAESGKKCIEMIAKKHYDLIFMDHMMPEMDGIETTRVIRRFHPGYDNVPIIALTANVLEETKSKFLCEGMNDFVAKPIEVKTITQAVKNWLPPDKIKPISDKNKQADAEQNTVHIPEIPELNIKEAVSLVGSEDILWKIIGSYYKGIQKKYDIIRESYDSEDWDRYTIEVHALKSSSRQIGAQKIGSMAEKLEMAGKKGDVQYIKENTDELLQEYISFETTLKKYFVEEAVAKKTQVDNAYTLQLLTKAHEAAEELDFVALEQFAEELKHYQYEGREKELHEELILAIEVFDVDSCDRLIDEWKTDFLEKHM